MQSPEKKAAQEQITASQPRNSVWVSANAGTGKTFILVNRFLRLVLEGSDPSRILCITYTRAAAAEMQNRIAEKISELLLLDDDSLHKRLLAEHGEAPERKDIARARVRMTAILDNPAQLQIQTIHAFCQGILRSFPMEAGVPPFFNVLEDIAKKEVEAKAWNIVVEMAEAQEALSKLLSRFRAQEVRKLMMELAARSADIEAVLAQHGNYAEYLKKLLDIGDENIAEMEEGIRQRSSELVGRIMQAQVNAGDKNVAKQLERYSNDNSIDKLYTVFFTEKGGVRTYYTGKKFAEKYPRESAAAVEFAPLLAEFMEKRRDHELYNITMDVLGLYGVFHAEFSRIKQQHYMLDHDDQIELATKLLESGNPEAAWILYRLDGKLDHLLLDEAQDTSPRQWKIVHAIADEFFSGAGVGEDRNRSLFVVGDEKQSIYSFQGADVAVFNSKKEHFRELKEASPEANFEFVGLRKSFRSAPAVLKLVDKVLENDGLRNAVAGSGELLLHEPHRSTAAGKFEIYGLTGKKAASGGRSKEQAEWRLPREYEEDEEENNKEMLAAQVAEKVKAVLARSEAVASTGKRPQPDDIMILMKKRSGGLAELIIKQLQALSIPVSGIDRLTLNGNLAIKDIMSLAQFSLLESDDLNTACLLKSPVMGFDEQRLFEACNGRGKQNVIGYMRGKNEFAKDVARLDNLRGNNGDAFEFFFNALDVKGLRALLMAHHGPQVNEVLDEFLGAVKTSADQNGSSLQQFVSWFSRNEITIKRNLAASYGEVRLMTVHGSKGLEAPIVIIPDTTSDNRVDNRFALSNGVFLCPVLAANQNELFKQISKAQQARGEDEYYRLLYVALTRARDELYVYGYENKKTANKETWHNILLKAAGELAEQSENGYFYSDEGFGKVAEKAEEEAGAEVLELPERYKAHNDVEIVSPSKLYRAEESNKLSLKNVDFTRGLAIHKLLEVLPPADIARRGTVAEVALKNWPALEDAEKQDILKEAFATLDNSEFSFIFKEGGMAEVPVCGMVEGKFVSGQMDRLVVSENEVTVVDFKTNKITADKAEGVAKKYEGQMNAYKMLLKNIYGRPIKAALLFTHCSKLVYV